MTHKATPMECALDWLGRAALILACALFGVYAYAAFLERPWLEYQALPFEVIGPVHPGEAIQLVVMRCNTSSTKKTYRVTRRLLNVDTGESAILPSTDVDIAPGCMREISRVTIVPPGIEPGTYVVTGVGKAQGRLVTHEVPWSSVRFEITAKTSQPDVPRGTNTQ